MSYIKEIKSVVDSALSELNDAKAAGKIQNNPVSEDSFLCRWVAQSIKKQRFDNVVLKDLTRWVQQGRSMGKHANLKGQMLHIASVYHHQFPDGDEHVAVTIAQFDDLLTELEKNDWMVHTDQEISRKMRVISDGQHSFVANSAAVEKSFNEAGELVKPMSLYVRGPEAWFIEAFLANGLLATKVTDYKSIIKYHGEYKIWPRNQADCLVVLPESLKP
ncbi:hypothetical protein A1OO_08855 [Enterovibrio norvegicus FF-33]|uniref:Alpha-acetolactate decarboxylase n=1 Tax=Enterovibrio norvegicus FF-454 TaxID=1185651 RepID=A0A1E5C9W0_9GAMM|nr:DUF2913 family protein [Enterovibrio norvegicus]OEE62256.1 hypothetical protein A1OK_01740 [Enterovibrio norvegicus FF-454]OEE65908.1 hypothetical protein A1OO_08855 [Enterovibrio norvegicus FF-33]